MTTKEIANQTGNSMRTVQKWCVIFGFKKTGRDYLLTEKQILLIKRKMQSNPGRPGP